MPAEVAYVQAIDWLLDRFVTAVNVSGDTMVCRIVAHLMQDEMERASALEESRRGSGAKPDDGPTAD